MPNIWKACYFVTNLPLILSLFSATYFLHSYVNFLESFLSLFFPRNFTTFWNLSGIVSEPTCFVSPISYAYLSLSASISFFLLWTFIYLFDSSLCEFSTLIYGVLYLKWFFLKDWHVLILTDFSEVAQDAHSIFRGLSAFLTSLFKSESTCVF
jgi:hypothetical protein